MDDISDDTTLMPPPNKRTRATEKHRPSKEGEEEENEDEDQVDFPKFDSDELARQFFEDLELHSALDLSVSPITRVLPTTATFTEGIYYAQGHHHYHHHHHHHHHRSPLAPLRQELAAAWIEPTCSRKRKFTTTFEIYEDPTDVDVETSWPSLSQFDPTNNWYASASDDKENMSDHGGYEQMDMDIDDMEDDGYPSHERRSILRGEEEEYYVPGSSHHGIYILESTGQQTYHDNYNHQEHTGDDLVDYTESDMDAARIFDDIFFPESSTSSSSFSSGSSGLENWAEYFQVSPPPPPPRAYGPPRNRPRAHDFF